MIKTESDHILGIDIGGTKIIFVLMEGKDVVLAKKVLTPEDKNELLKVLEENIKELKEKAKVEKIGIGIAGALDKKREKVLFSPNLKYLNNLPLRNILEKKLEIEVSMENDVNCFALAEAVLGAGKNKKIVFGITLGSGVGGGLVIKIQNPKSRTQNYKIFRGAFGGAGEIGHTTIKFNGPECTCGSLGCLEEYTSERFFRKKTNRSPQFLFDRAEEGDKEAKEIFKEYGKYLGIGIANLVNLIDPEIIIIGGGISKAQKYFLKTTEQTAKKNIFSPSSKRNLEIKTSKLEDKAVAIGAALLFAL